MNAIFETGNSCSHHNEIFTDEAGFPDDMMMESAVGEAQQLLLLNDMLGHKINQLGYTISTPTPSFELLDEHHEKIDDSLPTPLSKEKSYEFEDFLSEDIMKQLPFSTPRKKDSIVVESLPFSLPDTEDVSSD